ncbi:MAG: RNase adapter RapZ [Myxococcota bacterium]
MSLPRSAPPVEFVVISGLSGSGKTTALRALEDADWFCVDNMPSPLLGTFLGLLHDHPTIERAAVVMDVREASHFPDMDRVIQELQESGHGLRVLFLDCDESRVITRFKETRRRHPLLADGEARTVAEAIRQEKEWLEPIRHLAWTAIDTSTMNVHELKRRVHELLADPFRRRMTLHLTSFGFRHGLPREADFVFDVRFLPNPYFVDELRARRGVDPEVAAWVLEHDAARRMLRHIEDLLLDVLPQAREEGKASLTVAIGCTGGHHRSVAMVEALRERLADHDEAATVAHRDVDR